MDALKHYLNALPTPEQAAFAVRCGTTVGYLRKAISVGARIGESIAIAIDRESGGVVTVEELRPDVDWAYLRASKRSHHDVATSHEERAPPT